MKRWLGVASVVLAGCFGSDGGDAPVAGDADGASNAGTGASMAGDTAAGAGGGAAGEPVGTAGDAAAGAGDGSEDFFNAGSGAGGSGAAGAAGVAGGVAGAPGVAGAGIAGVPAPPPACAEVTVRAAVVTPTVVLAIDASASMESSFDGTTRWQAVRDVLDVGGLVARLAGRVRLGAVFVAGNASACPNLVVSAPSLDTTASSAVYPSVPLGGFSAAVAGLSTAYEQAGVSGDPDALDAGDRLVLWISDGPPIACSDGVSVDTDAAVAAVQDALAAGVQTQVVQLGSDEGADAASASLAAAAGRAPLLALTQAELATALEQVLVGAQTCDLALNGSVTPGSECRGEVRLNGDALECGGADGWRMRDERTIELVGQACVQFTEGPDALLQATFPCDAFAPD